MLVLTAAGQIGQVERARELGAAAIVTKPFSPKKLYRQVAELLGDDPDIELGGEG
jgi:CheY-like chemotaxis protein